MPSVRQSRRSTGVRDRSDVPARVYSSSPNTRGYVLTKAKPYSSSGQRPHVSSSSKAQKQPSSLPERDLRDVLPVRHNLRSTRGGKPIKAEAVNVSPSRPDRSSAKRPTENKARIPLKPKVPKETPVSTRLRSTHKRIAELVEDEPKSARRRTTRASANEPETSTPVSKDTSQKPSFSPSPVRRLTRRYTIIDSSEEAEQPSSKENAKHDTTSQLPQVATRRSQKPKPVALPVKKKSIQQVVRKTKTSKDESLGLDAANQKKVKVVKRQPIEWSFPCREEEFTEVLSYVEENLKKGTGGCMYVHGMPGTGKTVTVHQVIKYLKETGDERPTFRFCEINGMKLSDPKQTYVLLAKTLRPELKKLAPARALRILDQQFRPTVGKDDEWAEEHETIIALVDEMDLLYVKKQKLLYNLFDWPQQPGSKFIVIAISNTMDLPERIPLMARIESRLGMQRLAFQPYSREQLEKVVRYHLKDVNLDPEALVLASARVASITGDARRVLNITRRARDIAVERCTSKKAALTVQVVLADVQAACDELMACPKKQYMKSASAVEKVFLRCMTGFNEEEVPIGRLFRQVIESCSESGIPAPSVAFCLELANRLAAMELIYMNTKPTALFERTIGLNCYREDVVYTTRVE